MQPAQNKVLVMGIGNYLMGDEGVGVHAVEMLQQPDALNDVDILDGGTGGFHLLEYFEQYKNVILIDATMDDYPEGNLRLIKPRFAADFPRAMSTHDIGLKDLVTALQLLGKMPVIHLFVVSIKSLQQQGIFLSPAIKKTMPLLLEKIKQLVKELQKQTTEIEAI